jgi:hypothetical protein
MYPDQVLVTLPCLLTYAAPYMSEPGIQVLAETRRTVDLYRLHGSRMLALRPRHSKPVRGS